jgi:hypothetical protein
MSDSPKLADMAITKLLLGIAAFVFIMQIALIVILGKDLFFNSDITSETQKVLAGFVVCLSVSCAFIGHHTWVFVKSVKHYDTKYSGTVS